MYAQVLHEWGGEVVYEEVSTPVPGAGEALVKVEACGVGLTVLNYMQGNMGRRPEDLPRIPGHEVVGKVVELGVGAEGLQVGDRVMAYFYLTCGRCDFCRLAHEPLCRNFQGYVGVARDGGYAEYMTLPAANLLPVPDGVPPVEATAIPDAIATPFHVSHRAGIGPGDLVVVVGAGGGVGIHMVQMARVFGAEVIAIDLGEEKLRATREVGAVAAFDFSSPDLLDAVHSIAPLGVSVAIDLVGKPETLSFCQEILGRRGRMVFLTTFPGITTEVSPRRMVLEELTLIGSRYTSRWELLKAAQLVAEGRIKPIVSSVVPLARVRELHERLRAGTLLGRGAIVLEEGT
ncbi:MAG: alcohol dehydrogenase catalytic domain-containing protein [Armatimonadota bacterium]|nr:alcohol dehydrogenase catalytic domain-containing protein [Armatimonadota bacterium]